MDATKDKGFIWSNETITGRSEQQDLRQERKKKFLKIVWISPMFQSK